MVCRRAPPSYYGRSPGVLIYADPPYLGSTRKSGRYKYDPPMVLRRMTHSCRLRHALDASTCPGPIR